MMHRYGGDTWIARQPARLTTRLRLFCLPYAGGSARIFRDWGEALPDDVEVCAVHLPGRDQRYGDSPLRRIDAAVPVLSAALAPYLDTPYTLYGHSMGAVLAYELARRFSTVAVRPPAGLFVSAHRAPGLPRRKPCLHGLPDEEFIAGVRALNGTPPEVFENPELLELLMPMLRADFELVETYTELPGPRLACRVIAMGGRGDDAVLPEDLDAWRRATSGPFETVLFDGGHFFVTTARDALLRTLKGYLRAEFDKS